MRILKLVAITLGGLVAVLVIVLLAVRAFVNPNDYKDRIARVIKNSTGRELALPGDIRLSVFPWIALELGPASLGNPPGFGEEPFAAVKHAALRVRLLPLLRKQLEIGRVEIDGLDLRLRKNASGRGNWQSPAESSPTPQSSGSAGAAALRDLAGIMITDSRVSYQDLVAEHINLSVGRVAAGVGVPIKVKLDLIPSAGAQPIGIGGQFGLTLEPAQSRYRLAPMDLEGTFTPAAGARPVSWKFSAPQAELDLGAQTLSVASVAAQLGAAHLSGTLRGSRIVDAPTMAGSFKLDPLALRELMTQLGIAPPKTRDPKAFNKLAAGGEFAYENKRVGVSKLDVQLDDSQLRGSAAITSLETKAMDFDLTLNQIDIDRYRPPPENAPKPSAPAVAKGEAPTNVLKSLEMNGRFTLGAATFAGLHVTDGHMELKAKGGVTHIAPLTAKLYGGQYSGDVTLDDRGAVLASSFEQSLTGVDVAQLLKDLTKSRRLSGHGTITSSLTARGSGGDAVLKSLNGRVDAKLDNGAVEGIDLWFEINRATALIQKQTLTSGSSSGRTKFDTFKASADIVNGIATTKDLNIASQNLRLTGQGTTNLVTEAIDYQVKASLLQTAPTATASGRLLADIPVTLTGTMTDPKVRPDLEGLAKAQVQQQFDKHKQEALQKLQDQLKGLLK
jgi:AsmA protein